MAYVKINEGNKGNTPSKIINIHPTASAGNKIYSGTEGHFSRCIQCGFPINARRVSRGSGYGNEKQENISGSLAKDPVVTGGCPLCGSSNYDGRI